LLPIPPSFKGVEQMVSSPILCRLPLSAKRQAVPASAAIERIHTQQTYNPASVSAPVVTPQLAPVVSL